jgi:hypothetical protein
VRRREKALPPKGVEIGLPKKLCETPAAFLDKESFRSLGIPRVPGAHVASGDMSVQVQSICAVWRPSVLPQITPDAGALFRSNPGNRAKLSVNERLGINTDLGGIRRTPVGYRNQTVCTHAMAQIKCRNLGSTWPTLRLRTRRLSDTTSATS